MVEGAKELPFIRALIPFLRLCPHDRSSQRSHLLIPSLCGLGFQHVNLGDTDIQTIAMISTCEFGGHTHLDPSNEQPFECQQKYVHMSPGGRLLSSAAFFDGPPAYHYHSYFYRLKKKIAKVQ